MTGHPVQVVIPKENHVFKLNEEDLEKLLLDDDLKDKPVVVVSVAGAFRKGKSFLLSFFLRYLESQAAPNWMGNDDTPLSDGFSWRGGSERHTCGIWMWSKIFPVTLPTGESVAVILLDTQGVFDSESTVKDCATIFALSTMVTSVQVYNLSQNIQENDFQHLQYFTEYGRLAMENSSEKPFQKLQFLVRDWSFDYEARYGTIGGAKILDRRLQISEEQHPEMKQLRQHIRSCFSDITCFLMPHPGLRVANNRRFDGRLSDIEQDFKTHLGHFVPQLLSSENLLVRKINGNKITSCQLLEYLKSYIKIFQGHELPKPMTMFQATAEVNHLTAVASAKEYYLQEMEKVCGADKPFREPVKLQAEHDRIRELSLKQFQNTKKMGGAEFSQSYEEMLLGDIEDAFVNFWNNNANKSRYARVIRFLQKTAEQVAHVVYEHPVASVASVASISVCALAWLFLYLPPLPQAWAAILKLVLI